MENCRADEVVRGDPECPDEPWSECSVDCIMSKKIVPRTEPTKVEWWMDVWMDDWMYG